MTTKAFKTAIEIAKLTEKLNSDIGQASLKAATLLNENTVFFDIETTGLSQLDQIIEIAIIDVNEKVLLNTRVKPTVDISSQAQQVHKISMFDLHDKPQWPAIVNEVKSLLEGKTVVAFNVISDQGMLINCAIAHNLDKDWIRWLNTVYVMRMSASAFGADKYGRISLADAAAAAKVDFIGLAQSALGDALTTLELVKNLAKYSTNILEQIKELRVSLLN